MKAIEVGDAADIAIACSNVEVVAAAVADVAPVSSPPSISECDDRDTEERELQLDRGVLLAEERRRAKRTSVERPVIEKKREETNS